MSEVKYGELQNWNDGNVSTPNDFMNLVEGNNKVRVFTNPYQFIVHWVKDVTGVNRKIKCAINGCPLCKRGVKAQYRWYIGVIDRTSGAAKILEISSQIYKGIKDHVSDPDWGDVRKYDINIKRGPKGSQPLYTVLGSPKKSNFSTEEKELIANFMERVDISKFTQPPTPEEVSEKLGSTVSNTETTYTAEVVKPVIDDEEFNFGDEDE